MYKGREVFASAPLEFVAAEVRFPFSPRLAKDEVFDLLAERLRDTLPIPTRDQALPGIEITPAGPKPFEGHPVFRYINRGRTASVTVTPRAVTVETTDYSEYSDFRELLGTVFQAVTELDVIVGVERVGLRYVDELRIPIDINVATDWRGYVADEVLAPLQLAADHEPLKVEGVLQLKTGEDSRVTFRYGTLRGAGVVGEGPLKRRSTAPEGPFFVVDLDSFVQFDVVNELPSSGILGVFDDLHEPLGALFLRVITDKFKDEVARRPR